MADVAFRAGRMTLSGSQLVPDARKGLVQLTQSGHQVVHLLWSNRIGAAATGAPELDVALQGARVERIPRPGARILAVHSIGAASRFFWLQEPASHDDEALLARITQLLAAPAAPAPAQSSAATQQPLPPPTPQAAAPPAAATSSAAAQQPLTSPIPQAAAAPAAAQAAATQPAQRPAASDDALRSGGMSYSQAARRPGRIDAAQLAAALGNLSGHGPTSGSMGLDHQALLRQQMEQQLQAMQRAAEAGPGLADVLTPEVTVPLMASDDSVLQRLAPFLPEEHRSREQAVATLQSPQFRRTLDVFTAALVTGRLDLRHFGLEPQGFSVADFLSSVQAAADKAKQEGQGSGS